MTMRSAPTFYAIAFVGACVACGSTGGGAVQESNPDADWIQLFNGRDLTGWTPKITHHELGDNYANTFRVEDGLLKVRYDNYQGGFNGSFGHLFYEKPFSYYRLRIEYRFVGEQAEQGPGAWAKRNSGMMIHAQPPRTMTREQDFPISIEAQLLGGLSDGKARPTANMCSPGTEVVMNGALAPKHCVESASRTFDGDQWVTMELVVLGDGLITHFVNGEKVIEYSLPQIGGGVVANFDPKAKRDGEVLTGGYFALQSESHPLDVRKIELLNLSGCMHRTNANYRSYFVHSDPAACR
jgi:3-keto-disaccharide hydrolase